MDAATGLQPVTSYPAIRDRKDRKSDPEAFRRAMQHETGAEDPSHDGEPERRERPVGTGLQPRATSDRREDGQRHIDLLA